MSERQTRSRDSRPLEVRFGATFWDGVECEVEALDVLLEADVGSLVDEPVPTTALEAIEASATPYRAAPKTWGKPLHRLSSENAWRKSVRRSKSWP